MGEKGGGDGRRVLGLERETERGAARLSALCWACRGQLPRILQKPTLASLSSGT